MFSMMKKKAFGGNIHLCFNTKKMNDKLVTNNHDSLSKTISNMSAKAEDATNVKKDQNVINEEDHQLLDQMIRMKEQAISNLKADIQCMMEIHVSKLIEMKEKIQKTKEEIQDQQNKYKETICHSRNDIKSIESVANMHRALILSLKFHFDSNDTEKDINVITKEETSTIEDNR